MSPLVPSCTPTSLPARSADEAIPLSALTMSTWLLSKYGAERTYPSSLVLSRIVMPDQTQSHSLLSSWIYLLSQLSSNISSCQPSLSHTARATSTSKPVYSPLSPRYEKGGYSGSIPMTKVLPSDWSPWSAWSPWLPPHAVKTVIVKIIANASTSAVNLFFIFFSPFRL